MDFLEKINTRLARLLFWIAGAAIVVMMLLTCADVVLRYLRMPIPGTYELICFLGAVAVSFAMAHTSLQKGHVAVNLVIRILPQRIQGLVEAVTSGLGFALFALITWQSMLYANDLHAVAEVSLTLELPFFPFVYGVGLSAAAVCLVLLTDMLNNLTTAFGK
ncbi:MAG: TRAP transporter small permease [Desulfobacterales bacterium]|nr:TRAP transporter small permease [Desulfobacterales bacterium]